MYYVRETTTTAWWDPEEVRSREDDAMTTDAERNKRREMFLGVMLAPLALLFGGARGGSRPQYRPPKPSGGGTCRSCGPRSCPILDRHFTCVGGSQSGLTYQCSRCGDTFKILGGDNPANFHSC